jgi:phytoene dehydrogenase-like protein
MTAAHYDVIVVGGGHNGLTCGAYLARAGKKTLVLERRPVIGGAAVTEEFAPGFRTSTFSYVMSLLHPKVIRELGLRELGLTVLPATDLFCPIGKDNYIVFSGDVRRTAALRTPSSTPGSTRPRPSSASSCSTRLSIPRGATSAASRTCSPSRGNTARSATASTASST